MTSSRWATCATASRPRSPSDSRSTRSTTAPSAASAGRATSAAAAATTTTSSRAGAWANPTRSTATSSATRWTAPSTPGAACPATVSSERAPPSRNRPLRTVPTASQTAAVDTTAWNDDDRPKTAPSCHVRELGGERVVYDPVSHEVVVLNKTAAFIFELCDGSRTVEDLEAALPRALRRPDRRSAPRPRGDADGPPRQGHRRHLSPSRSASRKRRYGAPNVPGSRGTERAPPARDGQARAAAHGSRGARPSRRRRISSRLVSFEILGDQRETVQHHPSASSRRAL